MTADVFEGGYDTYGRGLGVLMLDTTTPRPPGDVGNARSYDYPVYYETVDGADPERIVREQDESLIEPFIDAAVGLERQGAVAIITGCGFLLMFQDRLAKAVDVPVYTSSLLQIPGIASSVSGSELIGVISADEGRLDRLEHDVLDEYGHRLVVDGLSRAEHFQEVYITMEESALNPARVREEVHDAIDQILERESIGAILFECTNLRPYIGDVQTRIDLPIYDYLTLADSVWKAAHGTRY